MIIMNDQLYKPRFSGATLSKLVGISEAQFLSLRKAGLMIDRPRYSLQDVFYIALCNDFRVRANKSWQSIIKLFENVFLDLEVVKNIDFLNNEVLTLRFSDSDSSYKFKSIKDPFIQAVINEYSDVPNFYFNSFCFYTVNTESCYINLLKIKSTVTNRIKELNLKIDVERVLLSA